MKTNKIIPTISISLRKPSIRIYKETLHLLGNPTHVLLMINPIDCSLIISPSNGSDVTAHNVAKYMKKNTKSPELYSTSLIRKLKILCKEWQDTDSYKMHGEYVESESVVKFKLADAILINKIGVN